MASNADVVTKVGDGTILILVAMQHEARPMIDRLHLTPVDASLPVSAPMLAWSRRVSTTRQVLLVVNGPRVVRDLEGRVRDGARVEGVSVVSAAIAAWEAIGVLQRRGDAIALVVNAGTAGGSYARGARRGQVYLCQSPMRYHDRHIDFRLPGDAYEPNNYWCFGVGSFAPTHLSEKIVKELGLSSLIVSTGASFGPLSGLMAKLFEESNAALVEMEAAAISEVCVLTKTPFVVIKGCTDYIDSAPNHNDNDHSAQFAEQLAPVSETVAAAVEKLISLLRSL